MAQTHPATIHASATEVGTAIRYKQHNFDLGAYDEAFILIDITAASGTDTIAFQVQHSLNGDDYNDLRDSGGTLISNKGATASTWQQIIYVPYFSNYLGLKVTTVIVDSTATFTYSIKAIFKKKYR